jgi:hypothetical protein
MNSKKGLAARAASVGSRIPTERDKTNKEVTSHIKAAPLAKPVRLTADLAPQDYRFLVSLCADLAINLGRAKVPHVEVIRALITELKNSVDLQKQVLHSVSKQLSK